MMNSLVLEVRGCEYRISISIMTRLMILKPRRPSPIIFNTNEDILLIGAYGNHT